MQKYSVLMSVYKKDKPEYLTQAVDSMLNQTIPPEQFVVVIDGPVSDEIDNLINKYRNKYERMFTIVRLQSNGGLGNALNEGLRHCRNELVARMDADDISLPIRCEKELQMFEKDSTLVICGCNIDEFYESFENVQTSRVVPETYEAIKKYMRRRQPFNHPTVIYRKSRVLKAGGYKRLKRKEDFDLFSRMLSEGCPGANIGESLYLYRADEDNYARRKSWQNFKNAVYVYGLHFKRRGCSVFDYLIICGAEFLFMILPQKLMRKMSDWILRERKT